MSDPIEDVQPDPSTGTPDVPSEPSTETPVTAAPGPVADRTPESMFRELQRKQSEQSAQINQVLAYLTNVAQPKPATEQDRKVLTDDELWSLAQQGDRDAFVLHQQRITDRRITETNRTLNRTALVDNQLRALFNRYPCLRDPGHKLTQVVNQAYTLYTQNGYPAGKETMLEAAKTAIADSPEIIAEIQGVAPVAREVSRQTGVRSAASGVTGVTHNRTAQPGTPKVRALTADELALAKRMGVKDPVKARENFLKRNAEGTSSLGSVSAFVNQEDF